MSGPPPAPQPHEDATTWPAMAGLVLCGGASTRMGSDKARLLLDGRLLVDRLVARLATVAAPVWLAPGTTGRLGSRGVPEVGDAVPGSGPLGGIVAGLRALAALRPQPGPDAPVGPSALAVVAVDLVDASPAVLARCAAALGGHDAAVPVTRQGIEPLHGVYATAALPVLERRLAQGRRSVAAALEDLRWRSLPPSAWQDLDAAAAFATNLNTERDRRARLGPRRP